MAKLKITRTDGTETEHEITPIIEFAFEKYKGKGFHKAFREDEMSSDVYYLAYECLKRAGEPVKPFGDAFMETIANVEISDSAPN